MTNAFLPLVNYANGIFMMAVFGLVCVGLVAAVLIFMFGGKKKDKWFEIKIHFYCFMIQISQKLSELKISPFRTGYSDKFDPFGKFTENNFIKTVNGLMFFFFCNVRYKNVCVFI